MNQKPQIEIGTLLRFNPQVGLVREYWDDLLIYLGGDPDCNADTYFCVYDIEHAKYFHFPDYDFKNWFHVYGE